MTNLFQITKLGPNKTFVDLGSGVSNCVVQASLSSGCRAYGVEIQEAAADMGVLQVEESKNRSLLYGLHAGEATALKADFFKNPAVASILNSADVLVSSSYLMPPILELMFLVAPGMLL